MLYQVFIKVRKPAVGYDKPDIGQQISVLIIV